MYDVTRGLQKNGQFLLNTIFDGEKLANLMSNKVKHYFAQNNITVYTINTTKTAKEIRLGNLMRWLVRSDGLAVDDVADVGSPLAVEVSVAREGVEDAEAMDGTVGDAEGMRVAVLQIEPFATSLVNECDGGLRLFLILYEMGMDDEDLRSLSRASSFFFYHIIPFRFSVALSSVLLG